MEKLVFNRKDIEKISNEALDKVGNLLEKEYTDHIKWIHNYLKKTKDISQVVNSFVFHLGNQMYGKKWKDSVMKDYHVILSSISTSQFTFEAMLRELFVKLGNYEIAYNIKNGENNFKSSKIRKEFIYYLEGWFKELENKYESEKGYKERVDECILKINKDKNRFIRGVVILAISTLLSNVAMLIIKKSKYVIDDIRNKINYIYKNYKKIEDKYEYLKRNKLIGCILFRGMRINADKLYDYAKNGFVPKGTSWASELKIAKNFAMYQSVEVASWMRGEGERWPDYKSYQEIIKNIIKSFEEPGMGGQNSFSVSIKRFRVTLKDFIKIYEFIKKMEYFFKDSKVKFYDEFQFSDIEAIINYNLFQEKNSKDSLLFLGYLRKLPEEKEKRIPTEFETIFLPNKIELSNEYIDITLKELFFEFDYGGDFKVDRKLVSKIVLEIAKGNLEYAKKINLSLILNSELEKITKSVFYFYKEFFNVLKSNIKYEEAGNTNGLLNSYKQILKKEYSKIMSQIKNPENSSEFIINVLDSLIHTDDTVGEIFENVVDKYKIDFKNDELMNVYETYINKLKKIRNMCSKGKIENTKLFIDEIKQLEKIVE